MVVIVSHTNRVLRKIFRPKDRKWREDGEDCIMRNLVTCMLHQMLLHSRISDTFQVNSKRVK